MCHFDERNPAYPGAATIGQLKPGLELLWISYAEMSFVTVRVVTKDDIWSNGGQLDALGIIKLPEHEKWDEESLCIVNTPENRKALVTWLRKKDPIRGTVPWQTAEQIVWDYPLDFPDDEVTLAKQKTLERLGAR